MTFDPYHRWLGIPPEEQPPHHYRLLALAPFESSPEVIEAAADSRMAHLRNYQSGRHSALSQKLLNEVAAARVCLLNPAKKAQYDDDLRSLLERPQPSIPRAQPLATAASIAPEPSDTAPEPGLDRLFDRANRRTTIGRSMRLRVNQTRVAVAAMIVVLGAAALAFILIRSGGSPNGAPSSPAAKPAARNRTPRPTTQSGPKATRPEQPVAAKPAAPPPAVAPFDEAAAKQHQQAWADYLGLPVEVRNMIGMKLILIPPGEFEMGSTDEEKQRVRQEAEAAGDGWGMESLRTETRRQVKITRPFYIGKHEVTQAQWQAVTGHNPSDHPDPFFPVEKVSWDAVQPYLKRLNGAADEDRSMADLVPPRPYQGRPYRLPTEAEWEYACRAGTSTAYGFGDDPAMLADYGWFRGNSDETSHLVGQKKPNAWGLHDMHGSVWEWCSDWWAQDYSDRSPLVDPQGPPTGTHRLRRGGSWHYAPRHCRSAYRHNAVPTGLNGNLGFRVVYEIDLRPAAQREASHRDAPPDGRAAPSSNN